jgi:hypothetical protein
MVEYGGSLVSLRHSSRPRLLVIGCAVVLAVAFSLLVSPPSTQAAAGGSAVIAASSDVLVVAPGRLGTLKMGTSKTKAKKRGWIRYDRTCGWEAGRRAVRVDGDGDEVFKAYPDKIAHGRVLSFHAMGNVVTTKGVRAAAGIGKQWRTPGSTLNEIKASYPNLKRLGAWLDYVTADWWAVYTTGSKRQGWLDFYIEPKNNTAVFVQVRAGRGVKWGRPIFGC